MLYRRVMIFQRFSRNKLEKKNKTAVTVANPGLLQQIAGAQCHASHAKPDWTWGERVRKFEGLDVWFLSSWTYLTQRYKFRCPRCILLHRNLTPISDQSVSLSRVRRQVQMMFTCFHLYLSALRSCMVLEYKRQKMKVCQSC